MQIIPVAEAFITLSQAQETRADLKDGQGVVEFVVRGAGRLPLGPLNCLQEAVCVRPVACKRREAKFESNFTVLIHNPSGYISLAQVNVK